MTILAKPLTKRKSRSPFRRRKGDGAITNRSSQFDREYFTEENYKYEEWYLDQAKKIVTRIFDHIHPKKDWVFLEVGCALGGKVEVLRCRGFEAYGIDISRWCVEHSPVSAFLKLGSVTSIPCTDQTVDVTMCIDIFQYLTKKEAKEAIKELRRVTRKYLCFESITKEDFKYSNQKENPDSVRKQKSLLSKKELITLFESNGFRIKKKNFLPRHIIGKMIKVPGSSIPEYYEYDFSFNAIFEVC